MGKASRPWYRELDRSHWTVLAVAALGWLFDTMDQRLFIMTRTPALRDLLPGAAADEVTRAGATATAVFIVGWATGGLAFGVLGDRWGRARTMAVTVLLYSLFTGLSGLSVGFADYCLYRFLTGLGVGGEFAAGAALVAETVPARARPYALGLLQATAMVGTLIGTLLTEFVPPGSALAGVAGWRWLYAAGAVPALLVVVIRRTLRESDSWRAAAAGHGVRPGDVREIARSPALRRVTAAGMAIGFAGQVGLWAVGMWVPELLRGLHAGREARPGEIDAFVSRVMIVKDVASFAGVYLFAVLADRVGRRGTFGLYFAASWAVTAWVFVRLREPADAWWMVPLLGFWVWGVLGGFAVYFPELYPTRLRSTGTGFCYNVARYATAGGVAALGQLVAWYGAAGWASPLRPAAVTVAAVYAAGLAALAFAPETRGRPLPE